MVVQAPGVRKMRNGSLLGSMRFNSSGSNCLLQGSCEEVFLGRRDGAGDLGGMALVLNRMQCDEGSGGAE